MAIHDENSLSRRELLGRGSALALGLMLGSASGLHAEELHPATNEADDAIPATPVGCAVIGLGEQGRNILTYLAYVKGANVLYVCDNYPASHKKALELAPKATAVTEYKKVLEDKNVQAVWVTTPTHLHKQIVLDAIAAGKHVHCEAPLASTIEDARAIARAGIAAMPKQIFHAGLPSRTNPQHDHVLKFVRTGALGSVASAKAGWNKKTSWRRTAPNDARQSALNWRLAKATSTGIVGEIGIHSFDVANWFLKAQPVAVTGFGNILAWKDGREVADTVQCVVEYPGGIPFNYDATLANSFNGQFEIFQGGDAAVLMRELRAWMFKEADAPALGWEVYAYKEKVGDETGIALVADASKLLKDGKEPSKNREVAPTQTPTYWMCQKFVDAIRTGKPTDSGPKEGYDATVTAITANQAIVSNGRVAFTKEMFTI
jgi:predicted dehydrogenase